MNILKDVCVCVCVRVSTSTSHSYGGEGSRTMNNHHRTSQVCEPPPIIIHLLFIVSHFSFPAVVVPPSFGGLI